jgi:hypothetical protein
MRSSISLWNEMCGMIAVWLRSFRARTLSLVRGAACGSGLSAAPRTGTFARAGKW